MSILLDFVTGTKVYRRSRNCQAEIFKIPTLVFQGFMTIPFVAFSVKTFLQKNVTREFHSGFALSITAYRDDRGAARRKDYALSPSLAAIVRIALPGPSAAGAGHGSGARFKSARRRTAPSAPIVGYRRREVATRCKSVALNILIAPGPACGSLGTGQT